MNRLTALFIFIFLSGCMTAGGFEKRMIAYNDNADGCRADVLALAQATERPQAIYSDTRDAIIFALIEAQKIPLDYGDCNAVAVALINSDSATRRAIVGGVISVGTFGIGSWAAADMVNSITDLGAAKGNTSSITGSRVVSDSVNSSASGEGLGTLNNYASDESFAQGGLAPRQVVTTDQSTVDGGSSSGTNEPIDSTPGDVLEQLPAEP